MLCLYPSSFPAPHSQGEMLGLLANELQIFWFTGKKHESQKRLTHSQTWVLSMRAAMCVCKLGWKEIVN